MSDGSLMGVRFVVNMYEDGQKVLDADSMEPLRGSLYAHTGRQIKNGTESLKGREVSTNAVALYGSNISIEDFLGSVKEELGENLSANVKYAFGMDTETTAGFGEGLRYSAPTEADYDDLRAQNRELAQKNLYMEQQMEVLRQEFKASGGHSVSRASARGIAQRILKLTGSKYGVDRLSGDLWRVFNVEGNGEPTLNADAMDALTDVMRGVLNESEQKNTELREYYKPLRETLRGTTLEVRRDSAEFAELMNAYGDGKNGRQWGNVRKALFGRLNVRLTDGAGNWDTMQAELAESWPGTFDAENTDITAFTDAVLAQYPQLDGERLGVTGSSYGGYMSNWIITQTDRFKAAIPEASISNYVTKFLCTDIGFTYNMDNQAATPWSDVALVWEQSPLKYADRVKTPTMFIHSDQDYRCWIAEPIQMFYALKLHGVETRFLLFHGEHHGLPIFGKPSHRIQRLTAMVEWFDKHCK